MIISYNWLQRFVNTSLPLEQISAILTDIGLEVEGVQKTDDAETLKGVIVGQVRTCIQHPNADKLKITQVQIDDTSNLLKVVCGAPNVAVGQKVALATIGTVFTLDDGKKLRIKKSKIRGEESFGMLCSEVELGLGQDDSGILILDESHKNGTPLSEIYSKDSDVAIEIGLTPNRSDAMSHFGVARDLYAYLKTHKHEAEFLQQNIEDQYKEALGETELLKSPVSVEVLETEKCKRYVSLLVSDVKVEASPEWMQSFLKTIGLSPINNVVDITNFVMHNIGQPLHAYDAERIEGDKLLVRNATQDAPLVTLDDQNRRLNASDLVISDEGKKVAIAGVIGAQSASIEQGTTKVLLEAGLFDAISVRKTAKSQSVNTDSSFRFERGVDPKLTKLAVMQAALLLKEYASATLSYEIEEYYPEQVKDFKVALRYHKLDQLLGDRIHRQVIKDILELLDIKITSETNETLDLVVPAYRADVQREVDVIEEILRIYGYNNLQSPEKLSMALVSDKQMKHLKYSESVVNYLVNKGFHEVLNNSLTKTEYNSLVGNENEVKIFNPLSLDLSAMRTSLLTSVLENVSYNLNRQQSSVKLFEFGKVYSYGEDKQTVEKKRLTIVSCGRKNDQESWIEGFPKTDFFVLKGLLEGLLKKLGFADSKQSFSQVNYSEESIDFTTKSGVLIGRIGKVTSELKTNFGVKMDVFFAELFWTEIEEILKQERAIKITAPSKFPTSRRDLALLLDDSVLYTDLSKEAFECDKNILKSVNLFDVYKGENLDQGKKSYAMSFTFSSDKKTVTDRQIDAVMDKIISKFRHSFGAELRA